MPAFFGAKMWTTWRAIYVAVLLAWCLAIAINYYSTHGDFDAIKKEATKAAMGTYNWVQVAAFMGMMFGVLLFVLIVLAICFDDGAQVTAHTFKIKVIRALFGVCIEVCSIAIVALSSVYMYLQDDNDNTLRGGGWVMVLGATYLGAVVINRLCFSPALAYVEFMASPCISAMSKNTVIRNGYTHRDSSAYTLFFDRLYPQLPRLHTLHSSAVQVDGVSIFDILNKPVELGVDAQRTVAAQKLVDILNNKYGLRATTI